MASSSAHEQHHHHHLRTPYGTTAAPPPTPSSQPNLSSTSGHADALSLLLHRLPPTLSFPSRLSPPSNKTAAVPSVSLSEPAEVLSACKQLGFFQLSRHAVESELANSAESVARSLFDLPHDRKEMFFPKNWPLGFDSEADDDDHGAGGAGESFCLDSACSAEETELDLSSLRAFTREMEKIGKEVTEALASIVGFDNPAREDPTRVSPLLWISDGSSVSTPVLTGRMYPFVIGLQYQIRCQKYHMLTDSGWVSISPEVDSILVTVGDIAQVWSNGKVQKVRGRTVPGGEDGSRCISITLLITLPLDSIVSPMLPNPEKDEEHEEEDSKEERMFNPFQFEDYAWRIYHERLLLKDPLLRYRL
ncbi:2-oxoglutarate-dependent dioxygenase DAO [Ipomoea triloba]|uniref:2-oxoglutarate-dependent dioxygenase DAO n=1 Tax=Ipomoea triloba TaxID=35885 RepID=UPI00125E82B2|nr:2-oxoglutarate-dependent dioxygenase DAO [Ipomoea triloba]